MRTILLASYGRISNNLLSLGRLTTGDPDAFSWRAVMNVALRSIVSDIIVGKVAKNCSVAGAATHRSCICVFQLLANNRCLFKTPKFIAL